MAPIEPWHRERMLITVRTYPTPARKGGEVSCTAGVTEDRKWIRLYPIPYRYLEEDRRFSKYQWIEAEIAKASDPRPESHHVNVDSIRILSPPLSTRDSWRARKDYVLPLKAHCLCCLQQQRDQRGFPTLGFFKPKEIERLIIEDGEPAWSTKELANLNQAQTSFFGTTPTKPLEKIPFDFSYRFYCPESSCKGHELMCTDWEMLEAYRKWSVGGASDWERKFRQRFEHEMVRRNDTHFYVGTMHRHPASWIIVGLFYPRHQAQLSLM
jgi:hypothetical protein